MLDTFKLQGEYLHVVRFVFCTSLLLVVFLLFLCWVDKKASINNVSTPVTITITAVDLDGHEMVLKKDGIKTTNTETGLSSFYCKNESSGSCL